MKTIGELGKYQHRRRLAIGAVIALLVVALLFVRSAWPEQTHEYIEAIGLSFIVAAILGRLWCTLYIGGRKSAEIVRSGPYSVTRNPLYVFSTVGAMGIGAQTGSLIITLGFGVLCYLAFSIVIGTEEKFLEQNFGEPYRAYCRDVPRFFPKLSLYRDDETVIVKPDRLYSTFTDGLVFFVAYPFFEVVEYLQGIHVLPILLRFY
ncbi:protein-S-isoprenylcysteine O-methyltransferase Ste14 [Ochrobactrum daejeonense]|uniref:Protein-S-isoprenylcysteine O-methyltransferase Ste14 n=1 Tax=Brucella daejeonensis TaxID=659015 RepID=A0A7W9EJN8_9HYPH|nr:isoprenylcysteine carboxylmethyltransferase family protein [Brucella daejeonensis]MBB5700424.1 protein-S-isoprenylcysteine O-methyltransferase Ste14 [Brucella daejeonensis]NKB78425.1 isoprenylcysteine carboxylmethyltransferase family protein [Brucella daejeonensis]